MIDRTPVSAELSAEPFGRAVRPNRDSKVTAEPNRDLPCPGKKANFSAYDFNVRTIQTRPNLLSTCGIAEYGHVFYVEIDNIFWNIQELLRAACR